MPATVAAHRTRWRAGDDLILEQIAAGIVARHKWITAYVPVLVTAVKNSPSKPGARLRRACSQTWWVRAARFDMAAG